MLSSVHAWKEQAGAFPGGINTAARFSSATSRYSAASRSRTGLFRSRSGKPSQENDALRGDSAYPAPGRTQPPGRGSGVLARPLSSLAPTGTLLKAFLTGSMPGGSMSQISSATANDRREILFRTGGPTPAGIPAL